MLELQTSNLTDNNSHLADFQVALLGVYSKQLEVLPNWYAYKGVGGLKNFIRLIIEETPEDSTIYGIGSKGTWFDERIQPWAKRQGEKLQEKGISSKLIYDEEIKEYPEVVGVIGEPYKFLPEEYTSGSSIDIFGEFEAIYSGVNVKGLDTDITIFIMQDKTLAEDTRKWWQFMWDHL